MKVRTSAVPSGASRVSDPTLHRAGRLLAIAGAAGLALLSGCGGAPVVETPSPVIAIPPVPPANAAVPPGAPVEGPAVLASTAVVDTPAAQVAALDAAVLARRLDGLVESFGEREGMVTHFYRVRHIEGKKLIAALEAWRSPKGRFIDYAELNMIILTDLPENIAAMEAILSRVDCFTPQVEIEAKVVEIRRSNNFEYGFEIHFEKDPENGGNFRTFDGVFDSPSFLDSLLPGRLPNPSPHAFQGALASFTSVGQFLERYGPLDVVVQALVEEGYAEILSAPRIVVHNGESAELNTVTEVPIQVSTITNNATTTSTTFKEVGVKLRVKPHLIGTNAILLEINPEVSSVTGFTQVGSQSGQGVPIVSNRNAKTKVDVRDGETLVLGGLYEKRVVNKERRVPILGSIPFIGHLFTARQENEERTEIIFILRTTILNDVDRTRARLRVPGAR